MNRVIFGDCRETMRDLKAQGVRVQCCVTSPPYFGLRDYGHPGQIGLEKTPELYVQTLVEVFDCVRELLADDGVLWVNLGDSYATQGGRGEARMEELGRPSKGAKTEGRWRGATSGTKMPQGMKPKNLLGIPWRVAFALQAAGWYLRQDIIWHKPNPMPESVTDRCTKAHEYLFLLTKSERYYFDSKAMREQAAGGASKGNGQRLAERAVARTGGVINGGTAEWGLTPEETCHRRPQAGGGQVVRAVRAPQPKRKNSCMHPLALPETLWHSTPIDSPTGPAKCTAPPTVAKPSGSKPPK
jgi:hypothetical protein